MKKIAVPTEAPGGLNAAISEHFGCCDVFTVVEVSDDEVTEIQLVPNAGHPGGCMGIARLLADHGVDALIAVGMGLPPLIHMQRAGIAVYYSEGAASASQAVGLTVAGHARRFSPRQVCRQYHGPGEGGEGGAPDAAGGCQRN